MRELFRECTAAIRAEPIAFVVTLVSFLVVIYAIGFASTLTP